MPLEVVTITAGTGGADAAAILTALAAETASGYAFNANGVQARSYTQ